MSNHVCLVEVHVYTTLDSIYRTTAHKPHANTHTHTHTHTHTLSITDHLIFYLDCVKKTPATTTTTTTKKQICLNTAKIPFRAYNPTYFWKTLDTHVKQITCHLQSTYGGNSVRLCAEIQPERACKSNRWQRVTRLSQRIVGCWGKEERCSLPASEDGNILTASDLRVSHGMQAWLTLCSF